MEIYYNYGKSVQKYYLYSNSDGFKEKQGFVNYVNHDKGEI